MIASGKNWLLMLGALFCASGDLSADATNEWWAAQPIRRPLVPAVVPAAKSSDPIRNPIDNFVRENLNTRGLEPTREADRRTLIRRVYFDLTGLPPSPEEIHAFEQDTSTNAYERVVDRLLESPRYGERWARLWMDAVHFAETHGHDQDRMRTNAWPYRDYLISSFNADKPYARFVQEQVAGDVLFPDDPQAVVAMGFLATGPWDESSLRDIREDTLDRQIGRYLDRDDIVTTVMQTFTSTTVQCARCHDHKFDPISQRDYYSLQAVFAGVDKANRYYDSDPAIHRRRQELLAVRRRVERDDRALLLSNEVKAEVASWEEQVRRHTPTWKIVELETFVTVNGSTLTRQADGSLLASGVRPERDTYTITASAAPSMLTAVRLEVLTDDSLPKRGPGRQDNGNFHLSEFQVLLLEPDSAAPRLLTLTNATADFDQDGWTIRHALDGNEKTDWGIHPREGESHQAVFELAQPLAPAADSKLVFILKQLHGTGHLIGRLRLSATGADLPVRILPAEIASLLAVARQDRSEEQQAKLAAFVVRERIARELPALPAPSLVYAAASDFPPDASHKPAGAPRQIHVLSRGEVTKPLEIASPGALGCVHELPSRFILDDPKDEGARRAALARWLTQRDNPLTWRSIVNRVWHHHFGRGLVETPNDFGRMGGAPSHPQLLDWLAVWFRDDAGGSLKQLHRLIVTSATYRQSSINHQPSTIHHVDPDNGFLSRMNRTRLDAEQVRDAILLISGRLDLRMGGPSDYQFDVQPGIHVTPKVDYAKFDLDSAAARRRSVYRFLFRTLPDPVMDALDCPAGDQLTPVRNNSVTVQQALALWNSAFVSRYAEHFASRLEANASALDARINSACEWTWGRPPSAEEARDLAAYARQHGLANLCRLLFNSNEFMFVN